MTTSAEVLSELRQAEAEGLIPAARAELFSRALRLSIEEGRPLDSLDQRIENERERFMSLVAQGAEGHWYWQGPREFRRNDGRKQRPHRFAFETFEGKQLRQKDVLDRTCPEVRCIAPAHRRLVSWGEWRQRYSDDQILGRLRVVALRIGRTPTQWAWRSRKLAPDVRVILTRFGSWDEACRRAGLPRAIRYHESKATAETCAEGLRALAAKLGKRPSSEDVRRNSEWLREQGFPGAPWTYAQRLGSGTWASALEELEL